MEPAKSSGLQTTDQVIAARSAQLCSVTVTPAAADATLIIYDHPSAASGTVLAKIKALANAKSETVVFVAPVYGLTGIFADITGASAEYVVSFKLV